jgi:hypothetical protein
MVRSVVVGVALVVSVAVVACGGAIDVDDSILEPAANASASDGSSSADAVGEADASGVLDAPADVRPLQDAGMDVLDAGPPACVGADRACVPSVPAGFARVALRDGAPLPSCAAGAELFTAYAGLVAPPAECSSCDVDPTPLTVEDCVVPVTVWSYSQWCQEPYAHPVKTDVVTSGCKPNPTGAYDQHVLQTTKGAATGTCSPPPPQVPNALAPTWESTTRGCDVMPSTGVCSAGKECVGDAPTVAACVYAEGDVACPAVDYTEKRLFFAGFDDTRGCTDCAASFAATCNALVDRRLSQDCTAPGMPPVGPGNCFNGGGWLTLVNPAPTSATCTGSGGQPTGAASPNAPITVCCAL